MLAERINKASFEKYGKKYNYVFNRYSLDKNNEKRQRTNNEIGFSSVRGGNLVGDHTVLFLGENESIELSHHAYSRDIYIKGALQASKYIITKKNGLYTMEDLINGV